MEALWTLTGSGVLQVQGFKSATAWIHYDSSPVGAYDEFAVIKLSMRGPSVSQMSVNNSASREAGRALWGFPKELEFLQWTRKGKRISFRKSGQVFRFRTFGFSIPIAFGAWTIQVLNGKRVRVPVEISGRMRIAFRGRQIAFFVEKFSLSVFPATAFMTPSTPEPIAQLTSQERAHFLERGHVILRNCFSPEVARKWFDWGFERIGYNPQNPATWTQPRIHLPHERGVEVKEFAPRAWAAIGELCGGIERVSQPLSWGDSFIFNLGIGKDEPWKSPAELEKGWHKDGDFFRHFLDSPEQGLLVIVLWSDVIHQGGATFIACDSVPIVAKYLASHPAGLLPHEIPFREMRGQCRDFEEITGNAGDVVLLHPFVLHTASQNVLKMPRVISNPPVSLLQPMNFKREDGNYSLVERGILTALETESFDFTPGAPRQRIVPERVKRQQETPKKSDTNQPADH